MTDNTTIILPVDEDPDVSDEAITEVDMGSIMPVSYTHLTLPTKA